MSTNYRAIATIMFIAFIAIGCSSTGHSDGSPDYASDPSAYESDQDYTRISDSSENLPSGRTRAREGRQQDENYAQGGQTTNIAASTYENTPYTPANNESPMTLKEPIVVSAAFDQDTQGLKGIRIKVLSGDGRMLSAKNLARKLEGLDYKVTRTDIAPYGFSKVTVFYALGFKDSAEDLSRKINASGGIKPLTWKSAFDIIVISTDKKPKHKKKHSK